MSTAVATDSLVLRLRALKLPSFVTFSFSSPVLVCRSVVLMHSGRNSPVERRLLVHESNGKHPRRGNARPAGSCSTVAWSQLATNCVTRTESSPTCPSGIVRSPFHA